MQEASEYFQAMYQASALSEDSIEADKPVLGSCPSKAKQIALKTTNDSLNYAFGLLNGYEIGQYALADDSTRKDTKEFIKYVNLGVKSPYLYPELVQIGEELGKNLLEQKSTGLLGEPTLLVNFELIQRGFIDGFKASEDIWEIEAAQEYLQVTLTDLRYGESKRENEQFLVENALREGVITTPSGLQYEVIEMGNGIKPLAYDQVHVHYHGTLIDGTVFDSSVDRGEPITFGLNQVIPGWTEGVQLMSEGSKYEFVIPYDLAYGAHGAPGAIPPYATLKFIVELIEVL
jgi:FKBP-type peptidyl-prolyl cis-trans isomerase FklB